MLLRVVAIVNFAGRFSSYVQSARSNDTRTWYVPIESCAATPRHSDKTRRFKAASFFIKKVWRKGEAPANHADGSECETNSKLHFSALVRSQAKLTGIRCIENMLRNKEVRPIENVKGFPSQLELRPLS